MKRIKSPWPDNRYSLFIHGGSRSYISPAHDLVNRTFLLEANRLNDLSCLRASSKWQNGKIFFFFVMLKTCFLWYQIYVLHKKNRLEVISKISNFAKQKYWETSKSYFNSNWDSGMVKNDYMYCVLSDIYLIYKM